MIVLAWIGQILLFFIFWKGLHWLTGSVQKRVSGGLLWELVTNVVLAIILLITVANVNSVWWLMTIIGAIVGVITGKMSAQAAGN